MDPQAESIIATGSYFTSITTRIATALRDGFGARVKIVYEGDPIDVPMINLPCIVVEKTGGTIEQDATGLDKVTSTITVKVLLNKRQDFGSTTTQQYTHQELIRLIEGRNKDTFEFEDSSVMGILRKQFTVDLTIVDQTVSINYELGFRPKDLISAEGSATFTIEELVQVPNRT